MHRGVLAAFLAVVIPSLLTGQIAPSQHPSFEVASVKVNTTDAVNDRVPRRSGDRIVMHNARLGMIVGYAYGIDNSTYQLTGILNFPGPDDASWFDIEAIAPGAPGDDDLRLMFQVLLEDRFQLKLHREIRELPGYDLVIDKGGLRMKASRPDSKISVGGMTPVMGGILMTRDAGGPHFAARGATMEKIVASLIGRLRAPVRDRTGLTGTFDFDVAFSLDDVSSDVASAPPLTTAIRQELGLKLEPTKSQVEVFVIDHVEKPSCQLAGPARACD